MKALTQVKIEGLFLDYDGTISPINVPREQSGVLPQIESALNQIRQLVPLGIITTKDSAFILPKTPFAHAWATVAGLEIKIGEKIITDACAQAALPYISLALQYAKRYSDNHLFIEEKQDSTGRTIAFCVDWRHSQNLREGKTRAIEVMTYCETLPLEVVKYEGQPFFDVYPCSIDKGKALTELKRSFDLRSGVMYMGDSKVDNPAFRVADIGIGVLHEESVGDLDCDYYVKFGDVASLLRRIMGNNLVFYEELTEILLRRR